MDEFPKFYIRRLILGGVPRFSVMQKNNDGTIQVIYRGGKLSEARSYGKLAKESHKQKLNKTIMKNEEVKVKQMNPFTSIQESLGVPNEVIKELQAAYGELQIDLRMAVPMLSNDRIIFLIAKPDPNAFSNEALKKLAKECVFLDVYDGTYQTYTRGDKQYFISFK